MNISTDFDYNHHIVFISTYTNIGTPHTISYHKMMLQNLCITISFVFS